MVTSNQMINIRRRASYVLTSDFYCFKVVQFTYLELFRSYILIINTALLGFLDFNKSKFSCNRKVRDRKINNLVSILNLLTDLFKQDSL